MAATGTKRTLSASCDRPTVQVGIKLPLGKLAAVAGCHQRSMHVGLRPRVGLMSRKGFQCVDQGLKMLRDFFPRGAGIFFL